MSFMNSFINSDIIKAYIVINKVIVFEICERLQIESYSLFKFKFLQKYDKQIVKRFIKFIIYYLLFTFNIHDYKKNFTLF